MSPVGVEAAIESAPGVRAAAVVGLDDPDRGQVIAAAVRVEASFDAIALRRWCRARLPAYMVPTRWVVWRPPWPRTSTGKIDRRAVARALHETEEPRASDDPHDP